MSPFTKSCSPTDEFRAIMDSSMDGCVLVDTNGCILHANDTYCRMLGYTLEQFLNIHITQIDAIDSYADVTRRLEEIILGRGLRFETRQRRSDGSLIDIEVSCCYSSLYGGTFVSFLRDITEKLKTQELSAAERKQIEEAFQNNRAIVNSIINSTSDAIYAKDLQGRFILMNSAGLKLVGMGEADVLGKDTHIFFSPDEAKTIIENDRKVIEEGVVKTYEECGTLESGSRTVLSTKGPLIDENGKTFGTFGITRDITDRKQVEDALRNSELNFQAIIELSPVPLALYENQGSITYLNKAFVQTTGYELDDIPSIEQWWPRAYPDEQYRIYVTDLWQQAIKESTRTNTQSSPVEINVTCKNGVVRTFLVSTSLLEDNTKGSHVVIFYDITELKKASEEKRILEHQFQQSQKMEAVGQLAGGVAHDFNNKLMVIMGGIQLAQMSINDSAKVMDYLEEINKAAEHSRDITCRLLAFSRQQVISPQKVYANSIISETLKSLSRLIGEHISITCDLVDDLWNILIDPVQLDQIIMNMAINARDAMPHGGTFGVDTRNITIDKNTCVCGFNCTPGDYVLIVFRDSGTGMDQETLNRIFEPFFTTKEVGKGTGLGLATIYGIVKQSNGFINVTSEPGQGTSFTVHLPRHDEPAKAVAAPKGTLCHCGGTILLVEDDDGVRIITATFLNEIGFTVYEAESPHKALQIARDLSIGLDLVFTDFIMPEMDGSIMMKQIRAVRPVIKCVYASGYSTDHAKMNDIIEKGGTIIRKPYDLIHLSAHLKRIINSGQES